MSDACTATSESDNTHSATSLWVLIPLVLVSSLPLVLLSVTIGNLRTDAPDDHLFAYFGWRLANGATLYLDVWDNKPPGINWANAISMWVSGGSYFGVTLMVAFAQLIGLASFFFMTLKLFGREVAAVSTIVASFYMTHSWYSAGSNRTETFLVTFELLGLALYVSAFLKPKLWKWYLAGICFGTAFLFKQTGLAAWGAVGLHTIMLMLIQRLPWREGTMRGLLLTIGMLSSVGLAAAYLASQGALQAAYHAIVSFNAGYFAVGSSQFPYRFGTLHLMLYSGVVTLLMMPLIAGAAAVIHALLGVAMPSEDRKHSQFPGIVFLGFVWFCASAYGAMLSPSAFRHYLFPMVTPLMLLVAALIHQLQGEYSLLRAMQRRAWITLMIVILLSFTSFALQRQWDALARIWVSRDPQHNGRWMAWDVTPTWWEATGYRIQELSQPDDTLQAWGYNPGIYLFAQRENVCRYITTEKLNQLQPRYVEGGELPAAAQKEIDRIAAEIKYQYAENPPDWFVMTAGERADLLQAKSSNPTIRELSLWVTNWLETNFELSEEFAVEEQTVLIYSRRLQASGA